MKLNLTMVDDISVLMVQKEVSPEDLRVLRAGLSKTLEAATKPLILDLTTASQVPESIVSMLLKLKLEMGKTPSFLVIQSRIEKLLGCGERKDALERAKNPLTGLLELKIHLTDQKNRLDEILVKANEHLQTLDQAEGGIFDLARKESQAKKSIRFCTDAIEPFVESGAPTTVSSAEKDDLRTKVFGVLDPVLQEQGLR